MTDPQPIVIQTERLILRRLTMADLDGLAALYRDPEVRRYFPDGTQTYEQTREELEWIIDVYYGRYGYGLWATILKETDAFIGRCGLLPWEIGGRTEVEVAYLLDKECWGRGLATEAAQAIIAYAFDTLPVERLICMFDPENDASRRVATKVGMTMLWDDHVDEHGLSHVYSIQRPLPHAASAAGLGRIHESERRRSWRRSPAPRLRRPACAAGLGARGSPDDA